jgi:hypothetical protein
LSGPFLDPELVYRGESGGVALFEPVPIVEVGHGLVVREAVAAATQRQAMFDDADQEVTSFADAEKPRDRHFVEIAALRRYAGVYRRALY